MIDNKNLITAETEIERAEADLLNYTPFARRVKDIIAGYADNPEPLTIGIYGRWGDGKSSFLNLIAEQLKGEKYVEIRYNPWRYGDEAQMHSDFFGILSSKLKGEKNGALKKAGQSIKKYRRYFKVSRLSVGPLYADLKIPEKPLAEVKADINEELKNSNKKIIIFIDNVDRLDRDEIHTLFRLIKANADFKNTIFLIGMDPDCVAAAICDRYGKDIEAGKRFLEKIVNIPLPLPLAEGVYLERFLREKIEPILKQVPISSPGLAELKRSLIGRYFDAPREVIRVVNSFIVSLYAIGAETNLHDLFWVAYLKVKDPKIYEWIKEFAQHIDRDSLSLNLITLNSESRWEAKAETGLRKKIKAHATEMVYQVVELLFPFDGGGNGKGERHAQLRINQAYHFEKYFSLHTVGKILRGAFSEYSEAVYAGKDKSALGLLKSMVDKDREQVIDRLKSILREEQRPQYEKHIPFLVAHLDLLEREEADGDESNPSILLLRRIAEKFRYEENEALCLAVAERLTYIRLYQMLEYFINIIKPPYWNRLVGPMIEKIEQESEPFYKHLKIARGIMCLWAAHDREALRQYISDSLSSKDHLVAFLRGLDSVRHGDSPPFTPDCYTFLRETFDVDLTLEKARAFFPDMAGCDLEELAREGKAQGGFLRSSQDGYPAEAVVKQFFYEHLKARKA